MTQNIIKMATDFSRDFEVKEYLDGDKMDILLLKTLDFLDEEVKETKDALAENDKEEIVDGFGDVAFIALNGIYKKFRKNGDDHEVASNKVSKVMDRICTANLNKKQKDGTIKYVNGKVQKPEGWKPPSYGDLF